MIRKKEAGKSTPPPPAPCFVILNEEVRIEFVGKKVLYRELKDM